MLRKIRLDIETHSRLSLKSQVEKVMNKIEVKINDR